jgi:hypothetical protein
VSDLCGGSRDSVGKEGEKKKVRVGKENRKE